jgi:hypothetical protein
MHATFHPAATGRGVERWLSQRRARILRWGPPEHPDEFFRLIQVLPALDVGLHGRPDEGEVLKASVGQFQRIIPGRGRLLRAGLPKQSGAALAFPESIGRSSPALPSLSALLNLWLVFLEVLVNCAGFLAFAASVTVSNIVSSATEDA